MRPLLATSLATAAGAAVGSLGVRPRSDWYTRIDRPSWQPPPAAFPLVWTPLYGLIGWSTGRGIERAAPERRRRLAALVGADLAVNAAWCWAFFAGESPRNGMVAILTLDALNVALLAELRRADSTAAAAFTPYVAWTAFATALNTSIWRRNR